MGASATSKSATSQIPTGLYTEAFVAVLAQRDAPAPISAPVEVLPTVGRQRSYSSDGWGHIWIFGCILFLSIGAASWYEIVDPVWSIPITIEGLPTYRPINTAGSWPIESGTVLIDTFRAVSAADEWVFATRDPIPPRPSEIGVETAAASTATTIPPSQTTLRSAPELIASLVETAPNAPTSSQQSPEGPTGVRPANDPEKPGISRNGEAKGPIGNPFVDLYPGKPQSGLENITTASRSGTGASQITSSQLGSSADAPDVGSNTGSHHPHSGADAPSGPDQGQKESRSDKPGPGSSPTTGDKPASAKDKPASAKDKPASAKDKPASAKDKPASAKDKPASAKDKPSAKDKSPAGKSAPAGPQDNHNSNGGKPSPGNADQNSKADADKKNKDKPGKDKNDKAKGKGPH